MTFLFLYTIFLRERQFSKSNVAENNLGKNLVQTNQEELWENPLKTNAGKSHLPM